MLSFYLEKREGNSSRFLSRVYSFLPKNRSELEKTGELVVFVHVSSGSDEETRLAEAGNFTVDKFNLFYYQSIQDKSNSESGNLKKALENLKREFLAHYPGIDLVFVVCILYGKRRKLVVGMLGRGKVFCLRHKRLSILLSGNDLSLRVSSGAVEKGDRLLVLTDYSAPQVPLAAIRVQLLANPSNLVALIDKLLHESGINQKQVGYGIGLVIIMYNSIFKLKPLNLPPFNFYGLNQVRPKFPPFNFLTRLWGGRSTGSKLKLVGPDRFALVVPKREVYVATKKTNHFTLVVGIIVLLVISLGVAWGTIKRSEYQKASLYEKQLEDAKYTLEQAKSLTGLNPRRSRELAREARVKIEELQQKGFSNEQAKSLSEPLPALLGEYHLSPRLLFDTNLVREGFKPGVIASSVNRIAVLDAAKKIGAYFDFEGKNMSVFGGGDIASARSLVVGDGVYVLDWQRIVRVSNDAAESVVLSEGNWREAAFIGMYETNLYVFDRGNTQIWKYYRSGNSYSSAQGIIPQSVQLIIQKDFDKSVSFAIDGSVWVLTKDGQILKLVQGKADKLMISDLEKGFLNPTSIVTSPSEKHLYILDAPNARIVVIDKSGRFVGEYLWNDLVNASGFVVSEKQKKMVFMVGEKMYEAELSLLE